MPDIAHILAQATPRTMAVPVCLAGDLAGELDRILTALGQLPADWQPASMADTDPRTGLLQEAQDVREQMRAASVEFAFRALGHTAFSALITQHPAEPGSDALYDEATFLPALLAACCTDPVMDTAQAAQLLEQLNDGQVQQLYGAALQVNEEPSPLPF